MAPSNTSVPLSETLHENRCQSTAKPRPTRRRIPYNTRVSPAATSAPTIGPKIRYPRIAPVTAAFSPYRQNRVRDARPQIPRGVDGVTRGAAEPEADGPHQKSNGDGADRPEPHHHLVVAREGGVREVHHDEHQHEGPDGLAEEVAREIADGGGRVKGRGLEPGIVGEAGVVAVHQPRHHHPAEGADELREREGRHLGPGEVAGRGQPDAHGRIEVRATVRARHHHAHVHRQRPGRRDDHPPAGALAGAFRALQHDVGHDAATDEQEQEGANEFGDEFGHGRKVSAPPQEIVRPHEC